MSDAPATEPSSRQSTEGPSVADEKTQLDETPVPELTLEKADAAPSTSDVPATEPSSRQSTDGPSVTDDKTELDGTPIPELKADELEAGQPTPAPPLNPYGDHVFKEGGLRAWMTVFGSWMVYFSTFGMLTAFGVFESFYVQDFMRGRSPSEVAWIGSLQLCLLFMIGLLVGKAFDEGYFHHIMIIGSILEVFGLFMLSLSKTYWQVFLSQGVCVGLGMGCLFLPGISIINHYFSKRRAFANGIAATGTAVGGMTFSLLLNYLFKPGSLGFEKATRIAAAFVAVAMLIANLVMRTDIPPRKKRKVQIPMPNPKTFFSEARFVLVLLGVAAAFLGLYFPVFYIQLDAELHGIDPTLAFYLLTMYNGGSIPGRLLPNYLADKYGNLNVICACLVACACIIFGMLGIKGDNVATVCVIAVLYGFFSGAVIALMSPLGPSISNGPHEIGMRLGVLFLFVGPAGLLSGPIAGWLLGNTYRWDRAIYFSAVACLLSAALLHGAQRVISRKLGTWKV